MTSSTACWQTYRFRRCLRINSNYNRAYISNNSLHGRHPSHSMQHLQMPQPAPSCSAVPEAEHADHESEAGPIGLPSSDDREASPMIARLKERNRKAQRAFRARQKARAIQSWPQTAS